jgi:hypothetical protein
MPRPKSELTKSGKTIGIRVTQSEYEEYIKLGGSKWIRKLLQDSRDKQFLNNWREANGKEDINCIKSS